MSWFVKHIGSLGNKTAIIDSLGVYSYGDLLDQIQSYSAKLENIIAKGEVVAILSDYNFDAIALFCALVEKKVIVVPIVSSNKDEIKKRQDAAKCDWAINIKGGQLNINNIKAYTETYGMVSDLVGLKCAGLILFSSGSTGVPKAMIHNFDNLLNSYRGKKQKNLNMMVFLMFDHIGGLNTLLNTLIMGAKIILPSNRNPDHIAKLIEKHSIHILPASPTFLNMMLISNVQERYNLSSIKMITYGTEPMPESLLKSIRKTFPKVKLLQTFGTSETGITQSLSRSSSSLDIKFNDPSLEYKVVGGELWLKSKTQVMGYLNSDMDSFTEDGWFKTGDLVETLSDGYLRIKGRVKEVINVGGEKVMPPEIESVILELTAIEDCMVYGVKNAITGQLVAVQLVIKKGFTQKEIKVLVRKYCKQKLDTYKVPVKFEFVDKTNFGDRFKKKRII